MSVHAPESPANVEKPTGFIDLSEAQLDELMARIAEAREHGMALSAGNYDMLSSAMLTLATLQERISHNDLTVLKLQKLLGMVNPSERLKNHPGKKKGDGADGNTKADADGQPDMARPRTGTDKKNKRKKKDKKPAIKPTVHHHGIEGLNKGDGCPSCQAGKVYKYHPAQSCCASSGTRPSVLSSM